MNKASGVALYLGIGGLLYRLMQKVYEPNSPPRDLFLIVVLWGAWVPWLLVTLAFVFIKRLTELTLLPIQESLDRRARL